MNAVKKEKCEIKDDGVKLDVEKKEDEDEEEDHQC